MSKLIPHSERIARLEKDPKRKESMDLARARLSDSMDAYVIATQADHSALIRAARQALDALDDCAANHKIAYINEIVDLREALRNFK